MKKYRDVVPQNTTRRVWFDDLWQSFGTHHYKELSLFPYKIAQPRLKEWDEYMQKEFPDVTPTSTVADYRKLPFPIYYLKFKMSHQFNRIKKRIHRLRK